MAVGTESLSLLGDEAARDLHEARTAEIAGIGRPRLIRSRL